MRKLSAYLLAALLLAACTPEQPAGENTFYVSIPPLRSIVEGIVGGDFEVEVLSCPPEPVLRRSNLRPDTRAKRKRNLFSMWDLLISKPRCWAKSNNRRKSLT